MTQATDTDIRELKTAIDGNTRAIATQSDRIEAMDRRIEGIVRGTEANTKAIADLTLEMRVGFANIDTKFAQVDTKLTKLEGKIDNVGSKLEGKIDNVESKLEGKIDALGEKFDELTKGMGQRLDGKELAMRNLSTGLIVATIGGLWLAFAKYLFFGISIKP
jgi:chromosome segregation ATPase